MKPGTFTQNYVHLIFAVKNREAALNKNIKRSSSLFINKEKLYKGKFAWQEGYGSFTYSRSQLQNVYYYIKNQEKHHEKSTFRAEYLLFLEKNEIDFDEKFLFDFWNNV